MIDIEDPSKCRTRSIPDACRECNKVGNLFICAVKKMLVKVETNIEYQPFLNASRRMHSNEGITKRSKRK